MPPASSPATIAIPGEGRAGASERAVDRKSTGRSKKERRSEHTDVKDEQGPVPPDIDNGAVEHHARL